MSDIANVFVISTHNRFVHTYRGLDLTSPTILKADIHIGDLTIGIEWFTDDGRRVAPQVDASWTVRTLHRTDDRPSQAMVRRRLHAWTDSLLERVDDTNLQQAYESVEADLDPKILTAEAFRRTVQESIPHFGRRPLAECFDMVDARLFPNGRGDNGSPLHNLTHIFG